MTIFPWHQIRCLSYNLVTALDSQSSLPKGHIQNVKAQKECSCFQDCSHIKTIYTSHDQFFTSIGLKFTSCVTLLLVQCDFSLKTTWLHICTNSGLGRKCPVCPSSFTPPSILGTNILTQLVGIAWRGALLSGKR